LCLSNCHYTNFESWTYTKSSNDLCVPDSITSKQHILSMSATWMHCLNKLTKNWTNRLGHSPVFLPSVSVLLTSIEQLMNTFKYASIVQQSWIEDYLLLELASGNGSDNNLLPPTNEKTHLQGGSFFVSGCGFEMVR